MIFRGRKWFGVMLAGLALSGALRAQGQGLAADVTGANQTIAEAEFTGGWAFTVLSTVTVDGLAVFDIGSNGLGRSHVLALWRGEGTLLTSTFLDNRNTVPLASTESQGRWLVRSIAPLVLTPGSYTIGGDYQFRDIDPILTGGNLTMNPNIVFGGQRIGGVNTDQLTFPTSPWIGGAGIFGPNLRIAAASAPEPGTLAFVLLGCTLVCLRRKMQHA